MARQCFLRCLSDLHPPIPLPHNIEVIIGRNKITRIKDHSCSRQQLSLTADCVECNVDVKQLGVNPSGLDGFALTKTGTYKVNHGCRVEVLLNSYKHVIEFDPPPEDPIKPKLGSKRKLEEEESAHCEWKVPKMETKYGATQDTWDEIDRGELYVFTAKGTKISSKIAAFDMDGTLIKTKSGKVYPVDTNDWQLAFPTVTQKLNELLDQGFKLVILSNQAPIGNGRVKIEDFKKKIEGVVKELNVPIEVYIATGKGFYRKPAIGMWNILTTQKNGGLEVDMRESFFCGDAAGRVANWAPGKKKDHSMADKLLAENIGLKFFTPEQFFLGHSVKNIPMTKPEFIPHEVTPEPFNEDLISDDKEILVLVGYPGSGKSFLAGQIEKRSGHKYVAVCRDVLGTWQKCAVKAIELIKQGKSVIVDSTNPDPESRARWVSLAKELKVNCRCVKMATTKAHARHNNKFRELMKMNHIPVNDIVFSTYKNKYVEPATTEGFKQILEVNFNPCFEDRQAEKIYKMYLLEK